MKFLVVSAVGSIGSHLLKDVETGLLKIGS